MRASIACHLAHSTPRPIAKVWKSAADLNFVTVDESLTIHCRSEAQAILIADAINLPDYVPLQETELCPISGLPERIFSGSAISPEDGQPMAEEPPAIDYKTDLDWSDREERRPELHRPQRDNNE